MKKLIYLFLLIGITSCEFYYVEPAIDYRNSIVGRHQAEEYSETFNESLSYTVWIERSSRYSNEIYFENFYGADIRVYASVSYDKITINRQVVDGYEVEGVGTIYNDEITMSYSVKDLYAHSQRDYCETTLWQNY